MPRSTPVDGGNTKADTAMVHEWFGWLGGFSCIYNFHKIVKVKVMVFCLWEIWEIINLRHQSN